MKPRKKAATGGLTAAILAGGLLGTIASPAGLGAVVAPPKEKAVEAAEPASEKEEKRIVVESLEPEAGEMKWRKEVAWLGIGTEEGSEALSAQLGLAPGAGLVITYIAPESPAAKAGLQKNDVLAEMDGQQIVHPAQLRKLIQMHKPGDAVKLDYYRAGRKESTSITLARTGTGTGFFGDERSWSGNLRDLRLRLGPRAEELEHLNEALRHAGIDREKMTIEIRRSVEEARRAAEKAIRESSSAVAKALGNLPRHRIDIDKKASVIVKKSGRDVKTMVRSDEDGTYVIVADPKKQLTAHDKNGKLLFDGPIDTPEQQQQVPKEVWEKVKSLLDSERDEEEELKEGAAPGNFLPLGAA